MAGASRSLSLSTDTQSVVLRKPQARRQSEGVARGVFTAVRRWVPLRRADSEHLERILAQRAGKEMA